jgi:hypothetical protein
VHASVQLLSKALTPPGLLVGSYSRDFSAFDQKIGTSVSLAVRLMKWGAPLPEDFIAAAARRGAKTIIELQPGHLNWYDHITMRGIAAGLSDQWLHSLAVQIVSLRQPIIVSFAPEMNGKWYVYGSENVSGPVYIGAYQHVYTVLVRDINTRLKHLKLYGHASGLVKFMWQPSAHHRTTPDPGPYFPGSTYVDLVGLDGYYNYLSDTFDAIFGKTLAELKGMTSKPIMIGETAAGTRYGSTRQVWALKDLFAGIKKNGLLGLIWFDLNQLGDKGNAIAHQDWKLEDSQSALAAFRQELAAASVASYVRPKALH